MAQSEIVGRARATSGDSLKIKSIDDGKITELRLYGVDAIEVNQHCETKLGAPEECGLMALDALDAMLRRKQITCVDFALGPEGDTAATCYVGDKILNSLVVRAGWALAYQPESSDYLGLEQLARKEGKGIWPFRFQTPWEWRAEQAEAEKGN